MRRLIIGIIIGIGLLALNAYAVSVFQPQQGGTGISTSTAGNNGYNLYQKSVDANGHPVYSFQANGSGGSSTTINGFTASVFDIKAGAGQTSTVVNGSTTFILNLSAGCSGNQFVATISPTGTISCGVPSGGASSTNVFGTNGVTVNQVGVNATASLDTTYAAIWTSLETFKNGLTANGTTTIASTTNAVLVTNGSGTVAAYQGTSCGANQALTALTGIASGTCASFISGNQLITASLTNDATGTATGTTSLSIPVTVQGILGKSLPTLATGFLKYNGSAWTFDGTAYLTAALQSLNGATSSAQTVVGGTGISVSTVASSTNSTTTITNTGVTSFTGQGCVTSSNSTGSVSLTVSCISGNQSISFSLSQDATGTGSGTTAINVTSTVIGLQGHALPSVATGTLYYKSGAWAMGNAVDASGNPYVTSTGITAVVLNGFSGTAFDIKGSGNVTTTLNNGSTTISLINSGVASGTYNCANITVASSGLLTSAAGGSCGGGSTGLASSTPWTANTLPLIKDGNSLTNSLVTQSATSVQILYNPTQSTSTALIVAGVVPQNLPNASGTFFAVNTATSTGSDFVVLQVNSSTKFRIDANGSTTAANLVITGATNATCLKTDSGGAVTASSACLTANQSITLTISGDASGTASGATAINDSLTVQGILGKALPALATGTLQYYGGAWNWVNPTSSLVLANATGTFVAFGGSTCSSGLANQISSSGTLLCSTSYVSSVNGQTGAVTTPATTTVNGVQQATFNLIGDNVDVTSTQANGTTTFKLIPTGVASGTYNCANTTVASSGRITSIAAGTCSGGSGIASTTPWNLQNLTVASGTGIATVPYKPSDFLASSTQYQTPLSFPLAYGSTTHVGAGSYLGFSGNNLTVSSTLASSSLSFNFYTPTTTAGYNFAVQYTGNQKSIIYIDCGEDAAATDTIQIGYATTSAKGITGLIGQFILGSASAGVACGSAGNSTTTFTTSTLPANSWLIANVTSTAGTPTHLTIDVSATKK